MHAGKPRVCVCKGVSSRKAICLGNLKMTAAVWAGGPLAFVSSFAHHVVVATCNVSLQLIGFTPDQDVRTYARNICEKIKVLFESESCGQEVLGNNNWFERYDREATIAAGRLGTL